MGSFHTFFLSDDDHFSVCLSSSIDKNDKSDDATKDYGFYKKGSTDNWEYTYYNCIKNYTNRR